MVDLQTLAAAKSYINKSLHGAGAIVGKNVQVSKIEPIVGGNRVTFTYTLDNGVQTNSYLEVMNGEKGDSVVSASINEFRELTFVLSTGKTINAGKIIIDSPNINLDNYYTKDQAKENFVLKIELDNLLSEKINEKIITASSEEIINLFKTEG